ncbi:MAG: PaaI family thioesterase [Deltaproteobacteria bacterium]|nr:PaaI family thioesterase [Deltaproteobacteria bacterium]
MKELRDDRYCFACGPENPIGLKIVVDCTGGEAVSRLTLERVHEGWANVIHGGIISTILDEIMAHAVYYYLGPGVTTSLKVDFKSPLAPGETIIVRGWIKERRSRAAIASAEITTEKDRRLIASGESYFILLSRKNKEKGYA